LGITPSVPQRDVTGRLLTNVFNTLNQLTKVTDGDDATHADLVYTIDGLLSTLTYPNGRRFLCFS